MVRNTHDLIEDHHGVLDDAQLASGTPASGDAPLSNGDGTRTWGPAGGGPGTTPDLEAVLTEGNDTGGLALVSADSPFLTPATLDLSAPNVTISGADAPTGEDGGYVDLLAGAGGYNAGNYAGGAGLFLDRGTGAGTGGSAYLSTGNAKTGTNENGGDITLAAGAGDGAGRDGLVFIDLDSLPTSDPGEQGALYRDGSGNLKVSI